MSKNGLSDNLTPLSSLPSSVRIKLAKMVSKRLSIMDQISELEVTKSAYTTEIETILTSAGLEEAKIKGEGWTSSMKTRVTRTISGMKLVEHGVPIKIIELCTEEKVSKPYLDIRRDKEGKDS
jgi:hypothetical protein